MATSVSGNTTPTIPKLGRVRSYKERASYSREALKSIFQAQPLAHVGFLHSGKGLEDEDGETAPRVMCMPLLTVLADYEPLENHNETDDSEEALQRGELVVYLHTYPGSRLVQAVKEGIDNLTITASMIDGLIFSPTAHNHSVNYRSATIHGYGPVLLPNEPVSSFEEKRRVLGIVTDTVTGYGRCEKVGEPIDKEVWKTAVVRVRIATASCKQRVGGYGGSLPEPKDGEKEPEWAGVVPAWVQFGTPVGAGKGEDQIKALTEQRSLRAKEFAEKVASGEGKIDGRA